MMNMRNKKTKKGFTLTELLIALAIIGAIAALTIPSLMNTINNKILVTQLKSITGSVQELITDQMVAKKTKTLEDTAFNTPPSLIGNFAVAETCSTWADCWNPDGNTTYRTIGGSTASLNTSEVSAKLKTGGVISYSLSDTIVGSYTAIGRFDIDVNGNEPPNIIGRDMFSFYVTEDGKIVTSKDIGTETLCSSCVGGNALYCYEVVVGSGWRPVYNEVSSCVKRIGNNS